MDIYGAFSEVYDRMMEEIPYQKWCSFVSQLFAQEGISDGLLLELGCGTGTLAELFAEKGYDMIGIDISDEMLSEAMDKRAESGYEILYLQQDMREFELYGTVRGIYSLCDSMNYLLTQEELIQTLKLANNYLDPGGLFIFDLKTDFYFRETAKAPVQAENEMDFSYIWENIYDEETKINEYAVTLFLQEEGNWYRKEEEIHDQRAYSMEEIQEAVKASGMKLEAIYDGCTKNPAHERTSRMYVVCREQGKKMEE